MSAAVWAPLGIVLAAVITGLVTWLIAQRSSADTRRTSSGRIDTSDAATLWDVLGKELAALRARVVELETQLADTRGRLGEAQYTSSLLRAEVRELRALCGETGSDVEAVKREMATARSLSTYIRDAREQRAGTKTPADDEGAAG